MAQHGQSRLIDFSAVELARMIAARDVSPVEVTSAFLDRIEQLNPLLGAYFTVTAELALARAAEAERAVMAGDPLGPIHGVPISIKDLSSTAGVKTTFNSRAFAEYVPDFNDEVVARLLRAGAVMLGKTASPEFGLNATTEDGIFPPARNPWNTGHSAGGSSGGAAAALAARLCAFAEGSDGGGSIRIPAAACGVVGLKPSRARVPSAPMAGEGWAGFATSGPMARTVADTALGLDVIAGPAIGDPYWTPKPERSYLSALDADVGPVNIGWTASAIGASVDPEVAAAVERAAGVLRDLGHVVEPAAPDTSGMWEPFLTIVQAHTGAMPVPDPDLLGPHARAVFDAGRTLSATEYLSADLEVYRTSRRVLSWFEQYDVLLCPTLTRIPPPLGELSGAGEEVWNKLERYIAFTFWVNMTGQPAYSLPLATSTSGLPIGVQIVGRQLAEHTLIGLAGQLEQAMPWRDRLPPAAP